MQLKETQKALRAFGKYVVQQSRTNLTKGKKNVSKELYDSIGFTLEEVSQGFRLYFEIENPNSSKFFNYLYD